jgi:hypothetical protein
VNLATGFASYCQEKTTTTVHFDSTGTSSYWYSSKSQWGSRKTKQIWFAHLFWWSFHSSSKPHPGKSPNLSYVTPIINCNSQYLPEKMLGFHWVFKKRHPRVYLTSGCIWSLQFHLSIFQKFPIKKSGSFWIYSVLGMTVTLAISTITRMVAKYVYQDHPGIYLNICWIREGKHQIYL